MKTTYIHHSSVLVETDSCTLLFDYTEGKFPNINSRLPFYVFVSHSHPDHYVKEIYDIALNAYPDLNNIHFIISDDIDVNEAPKKLLSRISFIAPHSLYKDEILEASTLISNDAGIAYIIEARDKNTVKSIYFAGDLNAWNWDGDEEDMALIDIYHRELSRIEGKKFDLAFIPLDPRLKENATEGICDFFKHCYAKNVMPIHLWDDFEIVKNTINNGKPGDFVKNILPVKVDGSVFEID